MFNISLEEAFAESLLDRLSPEGKAVELTYLQVYLDKIYRTCRAFSPDSNEISFDLPLLQKIGNVANVLGAFLDDQISLMEHPEMGLTVLKSFVSIQGTKKQMTHEEVVRYVRSLGKSIGEAELHEILQSFIQLRILKEKDQNKRYELRHDALAAKVFEKITLVEKELLEIRQLIENAFQSWKKRGVLLSASDLQYIAPYESKLFLPDDYDQLIERSKYELVKYRLRRRRAFSAAGMIMVLILGGFTLWALMERNNAFSNEEIAIEERMKATASEKEAIRSRDIAVESDRKALAAEKKAIEERDRAEASELRIKKEKERTEIRERETRASNYNYLSKEVSLDDPTVAFRLAEYAMGLDPENRTIESNFKNIYYNNILYKVFCAYRSGSSCIISPDWEKIVVTNGRSARITNLYGKGQVTLIGHPVFGYPRNDIHGFARGGFDDIVAMAFAPDGKKVLTGSLDRTERLWDQDGNCLQVFRGHSNYIRSVSFSPDGKTILTGSADLTVRLWDLKGSCLQVFTGHKGTVNSVSFSPDGNYILSASSDSTSCLWDLSGNIIETFEGHHGSVITSVFDHEGNRILTGSSDQTARLWALDGTFLAEFSGHTGSIITAAFSPDEELILTGSSDKTTRLWDLNGTTIEVLAGHGGNVYSADFSPGGDTVLTFAWDGIARMWDVSESSFMDLIGHRNSVKALFAPDGKSIATISRDQTIRIWDLKGNMRRTINQFSNSIAYSPDGQSIFTGLVTAQLLGLDGTPLKTFIGHRGGILAVAFAPDGNTVLTGLMDRTARLWNLVAETVTVFSGHTDVVTCVSYAPDGKSILTGSSDNNAILWDLEGHVLYVYSGHTDDVNSAAFSPDGQFILTGSDDRTARIWDLQGRIRMTFQGHTGSVNAVDFSPDGHSILTGSSDKTARIWDLRGNTLQIYDGYKSGILSVAFSPDGRSVLIGSGDQMARLAPIKMPLDRFLKSQLAEGLNLNQRLQYEMIRIDELEDENDLARCLKERNTVLPRQKRVLTKMNCS